MCQLCENLNYPEEAHERACDDRDSYREALEALYTVVGLTAIKYESQKDVLQEAMDNAARVLYPKR